jgi:hypothetical protein
LHRQVEHRLAHVGAQPTHIAFDVADSRQTAEINQLSLETRHIQRFPHQWLEARADSAFQCSVLALDPKFRELPQHHLKPSRSW